MYNFIVFMLFQNVFFCVVSSVHMPLFDNLHAPLVVDIDFKHMNRRLKNYIDSRIENQVNETCFGQIDHAVSIKHLEIKTKMADEMSETKNMLNSKFSALAEDFKLKFQDLVQNLKNENELLRNQLEEKNKEKSDSLRNDIVELNKKVVYMSGNKRVAVTACITDRLLHSAGYVWKFDEIRTYTGIDDISSFNQTGKFKCESEGLYLVSAFIMSYTQYSQFYIYKNGFKMVRTYISNDRNKGHYTGTGVVTVELMVNDTVWVSPGYKMVALASRSSCLTIVKI